MSTNKISPELFKFIIHDNPEERGYHPTQYSMKLGTDIMAGGSGGKTERPPNYDKKLDGSPMYTHINKDYLDY